MANKTNFTPEEWSRVVASPLLVGMVAQKAAEAGTEGGSGLWRSSRQRCGESHCSEKGNHAPAMGDPTPKA